MPQTTGTVETAEAEKTEAPATPALNLSALEKDIEAVIPATVADVPDEVKAFVNRAHDFWKQQPSKWRSVTLGTENDAQAILKMARKFAKSTGRSFRVKGSPTENGTMIYKVTNPPATDTGQDSAGQDAAPAAE